MAVLLLSHYKASSRRDLRYQPPGFTLIEVLIALAIISIALMAVIKAASQTIRSTSYLQNKMIGVWVGQQVINEARAGLTKIEGPSNNLRLSTHYLGHEWYWRIEEVETPSPRIKKIIVNIFPDQEAEENASPIATLEGYIDNDTPP